jgi:proline iminopeptidase
MARFLEEIPKEKRTHLIEAYREIFGSEDEEKKLSAAKAWSKWEASTSFINHNPEAVKESINNHFALAFALIENHYFVNKGFLENENQLLDNIEKIRHIPTVIIQGRYDVVCPPTTAYELHQRWPESELKIAPYSGHSAFEEEITDLLIETTNNFS